MKTAGKRQLIVLIALVLMFGSLIAACGKTSGGSKSKELTLYYSHAADWSDPIIKEFQEKTGITVNLVGGGTGELIARIKAESANPLGDVLWGGFVDGYAVVDEYFESYKSTEYDHLIDEAKSPNNTWYGFNIEPMVIIYNPKLVKPEEAPKSWEDLTDPKWKGKIAHADPVKSGSSFTAVVNMILSKGKGEEGFEFLKRFVDNLDGKLIGSSSGTFKGVADGEYSVGITYEQGALEVHRIRRGPRSRLSVRRQHAAHDGARHRQGREEQGERAEVRRLRARQGSAVADRQHLPPSGAHGPARSSRHEAA